MGIFFVDCLSEKDTIMPGLAAIVCQNAKQIKCMERKKLMDHKNTKSYFTNPRKLTFNRF